MERVTLYDYAEVCKSMNGSCDNCPLKKYQPLCCGAILAENFEVFNNIILEQLNKQPKED